ncbi:hypothetical protein DY218_18560 [Streptomyces triticagri]|uniref:Uncharacterized protein n=1 Tax=Streptomyces triticagri TaxID=2293568 RepID=A0A372M322_9ACTN|nr:hypothetical protein [Streptomyces triticagri]RFU85219.1 hypothetical protein DY218_18560 [Streptomyces triticagri]
MANLTEPSVQPRTSELTHTPADFAPPGSPPADFTPVGLQQHFNGKGVSAPRRWPTTGGFNVWGNTFPAEGLPTGGGDAEVACIPFRFPVDDSAAGAPDNLRCRGQSVDVPPGEYQWIHVLAAAERRTEDEAVLHYADGSTRREWLRISDFWPETDQRFGELLAFRTRYLMYPRHSQHNMVPSIWLQRVPVTAPGTVTAVELPDNPAIHIFAITLETRRTVAA